MTLLTRTLTALCLPIVAIGCASMSAVSPADDAESPMTAYHSHKAELYDQVFARREGRTLRLTAQEQQLASLLEDLKHEVYAAGGGEWPARPFSQVHRSIEGTALFDFLRDLPKGGMLHVHASALGDVHWIINELEGRTDAYVLRGSAPPRPDGSLAFFDDPPGAPWVALAEDRAWAESAAVWRRDLYEHLTLGLDDAALEDPWPEFQRKFGMISALWNDQDFTRRYLVEAISSLIRREQLLYLELRTSPRPEIIGTIAAVRDELRAGWPEFDLRLIVNVVRYQQRGESKAEASRRFAELMEQVAELIRDHPDLVVGFDLVAEEDGGLPTAFFVPDILELRSDLQRKGLELPLYLHAGESNRAAATRPRDCETDASCTAPLNNNLFDAVLLGTRRIGHGLSLAKLPGLAEEVRRRGIAVEVCPLSNQILGYVPDLRSHPAVTLLNAGVPLTLCSDDPGLFQYEGVTHDYWVATVAWNLDLADLKALAENSLEHAALPTEQREELVTTWRRQWAGFVERQLAAAETTPH